MIARISATFIVRYDPHLADAVASVRPYVAEVVIVCTSPDDEEAEQAKALADRFARCLSCNAPVDDPKRPGEVEIVDFSKARNRALRLATQPYVMWLDSDDTLEGGEHLADVCAKMAEAGQDMVRVLMPYLYDTDPSAGVVTRVQWRERIVIHPEQFHWVRPCHEGLVPRVGYPAAVDIHENRLAVRHHVDATHHARSVARNERIFRRWVKTHPKAADDPRILFDWGMSLADLGERGEAAELLTRYMGMSGRVDEMTQAALKLAAITGELWDLDTGLGWAHRAAELMPDEFEPAFRVAGIQLVKAILAEEPELRSISLALAHEWAVRASRATGAALPHNPHERTVGLADLRRQIAEADGDADIAMAAVHDGLAAAPGDPLLRLQWERGHLQSDERRVIAIVCGQTAEPWNPNSIEVTGIGGSERAVVEMGSELAKLGLRVIVYGHPGREGLYGGVEYVYAWRVHEREREPVDLLIAWRNAAFLDWVPARVKWLWVHDTFVHRASPYWLSLADRVLALSEWHRGKLVEQYPAIAEKISVTRNGVRYSSQPAPIDRNLHRAIYASSPDRGLEALLADDVWPEIRRQVPDAELRVFYGDSSLRIQDPKRADAIAERIKAMRHLGVTSHGRVSARQLAREMLAAGVLAYPTGFEETFCCVAAEAQVYGASVVTSDRAALVETVLTGGLIHGDHKTPEYRRDFVGAVLYAMTRPPSSIERDSACQMAAEAFGWPEVAVQWVQWLDAGPALGLPMPAPRRLAEPERVEMPLSWEEYRATAKVNVEDLEG